MTSNELKNEMLVTVLTDLAAICRRLADNQILPEEVRGEARQCVWEFNELLPYRGKGNAFQHCEGETLLIRIARFLPRVLEVQAEPAIREQ